MQELSFKNAEVLWDDKNTISTAPDHQGPSGISMARTTQPTAISDSTIKQRSRKYDYALGEDSPGQDVLQHSIRTGEEFFQRRLAATKEFNRRQQVRMDLMTQIATAAGGVIDDNTRSLILGMSEDDLINPATYFEKAFARKFISEMSVSDLDNSIVAMDGTLIDTTAIRDALDDSPEQAHQILDAAEVITAKREIDFKLNEDYGALWEKEGWSGKGISDTFEMALPFVSWYRLSNLHEKNEALLLGNNMQETYEKLALITDVDEYEQAVKTIAESLYAKNGYDAMMFLRGLIDFNSNEQMFGNLTSWIDITTPLPVAGVTTTKQWTAGARRLGDLVGGAMKGSSGPGASKASALAGAGKLEQAGAHRAADIVAKLGTEGASTPQALGELTAEITSIWNPYGFFHRLGLGHMERESAGRIIDAMETATQTFAEKVLENPVLAGRIEPGTQAADAALDSLRDLINQSYGRGSDVVFDIALKDTDATKGIQFAEIRLGTVDAQLFPTDASARFHATDWYGIKGPYDVVKHGDGYYIAVSKPISEDSLKVRQAREAMSVETRWSSPKTWANLWVPWLRSKDSLSSLSLREDTKLGTLGKQEMANLARELFKPIGKLSRKEADRLERFLSGERDWVRPGKQGRGKFSDSYVDFEQNWYKKFDQLPSEKETLAYMTSRQLNDFQYMMTNLALYRDKSRKGMEMFGFNGGEPVVEGVLRTVEDLWKYQEDAGFVIFDVKQSPIYTRRAWLREKASERASGLSRDSLQEMLSTGQYKIIQISDVGETAFRDLLGEAADKMGGIEFIIARDVSNAPLPFKQIPYNPGGHVGLEQGYFARVPNIRTVPISGVDLTTYYGDLNLLHFQSRREAEIMIPRINHLRELFLQTRANPRGSTARNAAIAEIKQLLNDGYVPTTMKELSRIWGGKRPKYDPTQPVYLTAMDESVEQAHKISKNYANWTQKADTVYDMYKGSLNLEWTGQRGGHTYTMVNEGSWTNPTWKRERAKYIDAIPMLERATNRLLKDRYIGHIKHNLGENFIAEHMKIFDLKAMGGAEAVRADPLRALHRPVFLPNADQKHVAAARNQRRASLELLDVPASPLEEKFRYAQTKVVQNILDKHGVKQGEARTIVPRWALGAVTNTPTFLRSFAFDWKLGLFNPVQLILQSMGSVHAIGVAGPVNGFKGVSAAFLHRVAMYNPDHLKALSKMAPGWKPEHLQESFEMANRLGWYRVGKETATIADMTDPQMGVSRFERARDFMRLFFKEGESFNRRVGWNAAYAEWRAANPTAKLTDAIGARLLDRADIMTAQMTSASNAAWQSGLAGIPTQFMAYQARIAEQFIGATLTPREKVRLFATYSAFYGLPVSLGAPVGLWEVGQSMKEWLIENDYDIDGDMFTKVIMDGMVGVGVELATGVQTSISQRVGPAGLPILEDLLDGDSTILEALGGVSGQSLVELLLASEPLAAVIAEAITGEGTLFDITQQDILDVVRTSSTGNATYNLYEALNTGKWITKKGLVLDDDISPVEAWLSFFGAQPMRVDTLYKRLENTKERQAYYSDKIRRATREFMLAWRTDNDVTRTQHIKRAKAIMDQADLDRDQRKRAFDESRKAHETQMRNINRDWAANDPTKIQKLIDEANNRKEGR